MTILSHPAFAGAFFARARQAILLASGAISLAVMPQVAHAALDIDMAYVDADLKPGVTAATEQVNPLEQGLRDGLAQYREKWGDLPQTAVSKGATLRLGSTGPRVAAVRKRLGLGKGEVFDGDLGKALRDYRSTHGLGDVAEADAATVASLNLGAKHYEQVAAINIARAGALPAQLGRRHLIVDSAAAQLSLSEDGRVVDTMRVIVGKVDQPTPMLAGRIRYAVVNPYWNVPPDLVRDKIAPAVLEQGVSYLAAKRYEVLSGWEGKAKVIAPSKVDWRAVAAGRTELRVRQLPGPSNGMGEVKFMFPNEFGVYLHDTPDKSLFAGDERRLSSGCVRLEDARRLARWVFRDDEWAGSTAPEQRVELGIPVPVYVTYLTAAAAPSGLVFRADPYNRDAPLLAKLARDKGATQLASLLLR